MAINDMFPHRRTRGSYNGSSKNLSTKQSAYGTFRVDGGVCIRSTSFPIAASRSRTPCWDAHPSLSGMVSKEKYD